MCAVEEKRNSSLVQSIGWMCIRWKSLKRNSHFIFPFPCPILNYIEHAIYIVKKKQNKTQNRSPSFIFQESPWSLERLRNLICIHTLLAIESELAPRSLECQSSWHFRERRNKDRRKGQGYGALHRNSHGTLQDAYRAGLPYAAPRNAYHTHLLNLPCDAVSFILHVASI